MELRMQFVHLPVTEETRALLYDWISYQFRDLEKHGRIRLQFVCTTESSRTETHGPIFDCHIKAKASWLSKDIFMRTTGGDYLGAAHECCHGVKEQMARKTKKIKGARRVNKQRERTSRLREDLWDQAS